MTPNIIGSRKQFLAGELGAGDICFFGFGEFEGACVLPQEFGIQQGQDQRLKLLKAFGREFADRDQFFESGEVFLDLEIELKAQDHSVGNRQRRVQDLFDRKSVEPRQYALISLL